MAILPTQVKQQLVDRFLERLSDPVDLTLYVRPGGAGSRLILPSGMGGSGCETCDDTRQLVEEVREAAPDHISLSVVNVSEEQSDVDEVPTLTLAKRGEEARIRWQGLPAGYEFATVVDAIERVSAGDHGLSEATVERLEHVSKPLEVMVFTTPT
jgi:alkyl hydroperoxide reductase subunit AhpF